MLFSCNARGQGRLVSHTDTWRYRKGTSAPQAGWKSIPDTDLDTTWLSGRGGFGFANNSAETASVETLLTDMDANYSTLAVRQSFEITNAVDPDSH
ncbi:MAG TPA: hypothetical protein VK633_04175, partial [Verrucomicrobiae bacterium]|nr:hypothetical protein [Verrucomicrobiae bacterium]